jgi:NADH-quinone oxidoreductase subunit J
MDAKTGFFYLFSVVLLFAAFRVVTARNPVHAVLNLILAFSQALPSGCCSRLNSSASLWCWSIWAL